MIIGVCGYGYTGSGAIIDLLKEYKDIQVCDELEFDFAYAPDGINDLYLHLCECPVRYLSGNTAIKRFIQLVESWSSTNSLYMKATKGQFNTISMDYVKSLIQCQYKGLDNYDIVFSSKFKRNFKYRLGMRVNQVLGKRFSSFTKDFLYTDMYLSVNPEDFVEKSKSYLLKIAESIGYQNVDKLVLNQPYPAENTECFFKFYDDPYAIIVDRDPRDLYVLAREVLLLDGSFIPTNSVEDFITFYKITHRKCLGERIINFQFEDLIYQYDETLGQLEEHLKLEKNENKRKFFNPDISINNTQLYKKYTNYQKQIRIIEEELQDYLYPFEDFPEVRHNGKSF